MCLFAAPLSSLRTVFRNKSSELLPVLPSLLGLTLGLTLEEGPLEIRCWYRRCFVKMLNGYTCNRYVSKCWKSEIFLTCFCAFATYERSKNGWDLALNQRNTLQGTDTYPTKREVRKMFAPWGFCLGQPAGKIWIECVDLILNKQYTNYRYPYTPPEFQHGYPIWKEIYCLGYPVSMFKFPECKCWK